MASQDPSGNGSNMTGARGAVQGRSNPGALPYYGTLSIHSTASNPESRLMTLRTPRRFMMDT
jgi:hypothetical protein